MTRTFIEAAALSLLILGASTYVAQRDAEMAKQERWCKVYFNESVATMPCKLHDDQVAIIDWKTK